MWGAPPFLTMVHSGTVYRYTGDCECEGITSTSNTVMHNRLVTSLLHWCNWRVSFNGIVLHLNIMLPSTYTLLTPVVCFCLRLSESPYATSY